MEKCFVLFFVFVLLSSFVAAAEGDWDDTNVEGVDPVDEPSDPEDVSPPVSYDTSGRNYDSGDGGYYTDDFYVALGLGAVVLIIIGFFVWLFVRGPKNKWD